MMEKIKVLLVEDEATLTMIIKETLEEKGEFIVTIASDGNDGLQKYHEQRPDVIVADVMMPYLDGFGMVKQIRENDLETPVLFLSARSSVDDVVEGFKLGCNDYLKKPFGMKELIVRVRALMNRAFIKGEKADTFSIGEYSLDTVAQLLSHNGKKVHLSNRESEILKRLCENKNKISHTQNLLLELWGDDNYFNARSLHVFITKLRQRLSADPAVCILNVRGIGYKLIEENA